MMNIEIGKPYMLSEILWSNKFSKSKISFLVPKTKDWLVDILAIRVSSDDLNEFNHADHIVYHRLHLLKDIVGRETFKNIVYWSLNWESEISSITYFQRIEKYKLPQDYDYQDIVNQFVSWLKNKPRLIQSPIVKNKKEKEEKKLPPEKRMPQRSEIVRWADYKLFWEFITVFANANPFNSNSKNDRTNSFSAIIWSPYDIGESTTQFSKETTIHREKTKKLVKTIREKIQKELETKTDKNYRVIELEDWFSFPKNPHHHISLIEQDTHIEHSIKKDRGWFVTHAELVDTFWSTTIFNAINTLLKDPIFSKDFNSLIERDKKLSEKYQKKENISTIQTQPSD